MLVSHGNRQSSDRLTRLVHHPKPAIGTTREREPAENDRGKRHDGHHSSDREPQARRLHRQAPGAGWFASRKAYSVRHWFVTNLFGLIALIRDDQRWSAPQPTPALCLGGGRRVHGPTSDTRLPRARAPHDESHSLWVASGGGPVIW